MSSNCESRFKNIDSLGEPIKFKLSGNETSKSYLGAFLTLVIILLSSGAALFELVDYLQNSNPQVTTIKKLINTSNVDQISADVLNFSISINDLSNGTRGQVLPLDVKANTASNSLQKQNTSIASTTLSLSCDKVQMIKNLKNQTTHMNIDLSDCLNEKTYSNHTLSYQSTMTSQSLVRTKYSTNLCGAFNSSECMNPSLIQKSNSIDSNFQLQLKYNQTLSNVLVTNGFSSFSSTDNINIDLTSDYLIKIKLYKNIVSTDYNIIFKFLKNAEKVYYSTSYEVTSVPRTNFNINYLTLFFQVELQKEETIYYRTYPKLDNVIANSFSLYSIISCIVKLIHSVLNYGYLEKKIVNKIYFADTTSESNTNAYWNSNNIDQGSNKVIRINVVGQGRERNISKSKVIENVNVHKNTEDGLKPTSKYSKIKHKKYTFVYSYCKPCFNRRKNIEMMKYFKLTKILEYDMDVRNILKKLIEHEHLKKLLLGKSYRSGNSINSIANINDIFNKRRVMLKIPTKKQIADFSLMNQSGEKEAEDVNRSENYFTNLSISPGQQRNIIVNNYI